MFKDKLKELREKERLSQQELADKLFVSRSAVAKWENGNGIPSDVNLNAICSLFEVSKNELFGEEIISEFRKVKNVKNKYKIGLIMSLVLSSIIIILLVTIYIIQENKHKQEYKFFKETMRENLNGPIESFGNVDELYLNLINSRILKNADNVFLNKNDFYVVSNTNSQDIVEIKRYNYEFKEIGVFNLFLHNGYNADIVDIKTLSNNDILIACNHSTYFSDENAYNGYSTITKLDVKYNVLWEYTFVKQEHYIKSLYEYNNKYYIFTTISELDDVSVTMTDAKISVLTNNGKLEKEEYITTGQWGLILSVSFVNEIFYVGCFVQEDDEHSTICKTFEYDVNLNCINSYIDNKYWDIKEYKSSNGMVYYNNDSLEINNFIVSNKYGVLVLCLNIKDKKLLIFENVIDYDWDFMQKNPNVNYMTTISQTVYLLLDNEGNALWCRGE